MGMEVQASCSLEIEIMAKMHRGTTTNAATLSRSSASFEITPILDQSPLYLSHPMFIRSTGTNDPMYLQREIKRGERIMYVPSIYEPQPKDSKSRPSKYRT